MCSLKTGLSIAFHVLAVLADLGPYFRSISYEHGGHGKWPQQSYHSTDTIGPILDIQQHDGECDDGQYILLTLVGPEVNSPGPVILDGHGNLIWTTHHDRNCGLDVQMLDDQPYLTFCAWPAMSSDVTCYMLNSEYEEAFAIKPQNGWAADATEFQITKDKTAVLTTSILTPYDLTPVHGPRQGFMRDVGFQEIDLETGALLFEWRLSDHWNITDVVQFPNQNEGTAETPWDAFHINSVQKDLAGNYLISARHTNSVGYISGRTGEFLWKLGGKQNMFKDLSEGAATGIRMQHHARFLEGNSTLTLFDNGFSPEITDFQSKGMIIDIDEEAMTAKVRHEYLSPHKLGSKSRGSMQVLNNDHILVGWGVHPGWSEYSVEGDLLCDVHFGPESRFGTQEVLSYRTLKRSWVGHPKAPPGIVRKGGDIYVSWNGATEVSAWALLPADADVDNYTPLASVIKEGFETRIPIPENFTESSLRVVGLDRHGHVLGFTSILDLVEPMEQTVQAPMVIQP